MTLEDILKEGFSFILSYGVGKNMIPAGTFRCSGFVDTSEEEYKRINVITDVNNTLVEFKGENGDLIYIPLQSMIDKYVFEKGTNNKDTFAEESKIDYPEHHDVKLYEEINEQFIKMFGENGYSNELFKSIDLDSLGAIYVSNGEVRATNYSVVPFTYDEPKKLEMIRTLIPDNKDDRNTLKNFNLNIIPEYDGYKYIDDNNKNKELFPKAGMLYSDPYDKKDRHL